MLKSNEWNGQGKMFGRARLKARLAEQINSAAETRWAKIVALVAFSAKGAGEMKHGFRLEPWVERVKKGWHTLISTRERLP
jgi:hypothetical protein